MEKEEEKVAYAIRKEERRARLSFERNQNTYGLCYTSYYTVPTSKNRYLIWYYMPGPLTRGSVYYWGSVLVLDAPNGNRRLIALRSMVKREGANEQNVDGLLEYSGHFLSRYRERAKFSQKLSTEELIATLFGRCMGFMTQLTMEKMNFNYAKYENAQAWQLSDGISFGSQTPVDLPDGRQFMLFQHKTFVTQGMLKGEQAENVALLEAVQAVIADALKENPDIMADDSSLKRRLNTDGLIRPR